MQRTEPIDRVFNVDVNLVAVRFGANAPKWAVIQKLNEWPRYQSTGVDYGCRVSGFGHVFLFDPLSVSNNLAISIVASIFKKKLLKLWFLWPRRSVVEAIADLLGIDTRACKSYITNMQIIQNSKTLVKNC